MFLRFIRFLTQLEIMYENTLFLGNAHLIVAGEIMTKLIFLCLSLSFAPMAWGLDLDVQFVYDSKVTQPTSQKIAGFTAITDLDLRALQQTLSEGVKPTVCDISTAENGKYRSCQCSPKSITVSASKGEAINNTVQMSVGTSFNVATQLCEKNTGYQFIVDGYTCADNIDVPLLARLRNKKYTQMKSDLNAVLGICYQHIGTYTIDVLDESKLHSIFDTIMVSVNSSVYILDPRAIEYILINPDSINY